MRTPSAVELLDAWELGLNQTSAERALGLLTSACPDLSWNELAHLPIGKRDGALLWLREALFGSEVELTTKCPACGETLELTLSIADIHVDSPPVLKMPMTVSAEGFRVDFRLITTADLIALSRGQTELSIGRELFAMCVVEVRIGDRIGLVEELPEPVIAAVSHAMALADPQADVQLALSCPACSHAWSTTFDIDRFLWAEVHAWARRTLREVHALARAYGWSERDVLELSPLRRQAYLELARA